MIGQQDVQRERAADQRARRAHRRRDPGRGDVRGEDQRRRALAAEPDGGRHDPGDPVVLDPADRAEAVGRHRPGEQGREREPRQVGDAAAGHERPADGRQHDQQRPADGVEDGPALEPDRRDGIGDGRGDGEGERETREGPAPQDQDDQERQVRGRDGDPRPPGGFAGPRARRCPGRAGRTGARKYRTPTSMTGVSVRSTSTAATRKGSAVASHARGRPTASSAREVRGRRAVVLGRRRRLGGRLAGGWPARSSAPRRPASDGAGPRCCGSAGAAARTARGRPCPRAASPRPPPVPRPRPRRPVRPRATAGSSPTGSLAGSLSFCLAFARPLCTRAPAPMAIVGLSPSQRRRAAPG